MTRSAGASRSGAPGRHRRSPRHRAPRNRSPASKPSASVVAAARRSLRRAARTCRRASPPPTGHRRSRPLDQHLDRLLGVVVDRRHLVGVTTGLTTCHGTSMTGRTRLTKLSRSISGKRARITGAASGMGRATAFLFADEGARRRRARPDRRRASTRWSTRFAARHGEAAAIGIALRRRRSTRS